MVPGTTYFTQQTLYPNIFIKYLTSIYIYILKKTIFFPSKETVNDEITGWQNNTFKIDAWPLPTTLYLKIVTNLLLYRGGEVHTLHVTVIHSRQNFIRILPLEQHIYVGVTCHNLMLPLVPSCVAALHENLSSYYFFRNTPLNSCCHSDRRSTRWGSTSWDSRCVYTTMHKLLSLLSRWVHCTNSAGRRRFYINAAQNYSVRRWVTQLYVPGQFVSCRLYLYLGGRVRRKSDTYPPPPIVCRNQVY